MEQVVERGDGTGGSLLGDKHDDFAELMYLLQVRVHLDTPHGFSLSPSVDPLSVFFLCFRSNDHRIIQSISGEPVNICRVEMFQPSSSS